MKTKWFIIPVVALSLGCTRENDTDVTHIDGVFTLYASSGETETKTVIQQDGSIFWSPGDCITVFYGNIPGKFTSTNTEPAASAEFTGSLGSFALDGETEFKAIYPHSDDIVMPGENGILSIYLPSEQTAVEGTFADDLFICVAKSKDYNLHFYNVCGGIKFSLSRDDIKKVVFRGNDREILAGRLGVEFASDGKPVVSKTTAGQSSVTLVAPDGGTFKAGSYYYLVTVPRELNKGYTLDLFTDECVETISSDSPVTVIRSAWGVLKDIGTSSQPIDESGAVDLGLPSGLLWASCNLGASRQEGYGDYYAWGETEPKDDYSWETYKWSDGDRYSFTKYGGSHSFDNKDRLDPEDDAAFVNLEGRWLIPTPSDFSELINNCTWKWTTRNGISGFSVTGPNGKSIFLPAAGVMDAGSPVGIGDYAHYGTSVLYPGRPEYSECLYIHGPREDGPADKDWYYYCDRFKCRSIRPIFFVPIESVSVNFPEVEVSNYMETVTLRATVLPEDATKKLFEWEIDNHIINMWPNGDACSVSYCRNAGSSTITVFADDGRTSTKTTQCTVVSKTYITRAEFVKPEDVHHTVESFELIPGESYTLHPRYYPEYASEYLTPYGWRSDDPSIATVNNGRVTGVNAGQTSITVVYKSWNNTFIEAKCDVVVTDPSGSHEGFNKENWD